MPYAATHVILSIVIVDLFRDHISRWKFSLWYVLVGGVAGLAPDIDMLVSWIIAGDIFAFHHGFTHTLVVPIILLIAGIVCWKFWRRGAGLFFFICTFGWTFHIFLDAIFWGLPAPLYPLLAGSITIFSYVDPGWSSALDAFILLGWLIHEHWQAGKDYI